ncbi:MAG TPA: universal stress protein [Longimicrobiales bacterium]
MPDIIVVPLDGSDLAETALPVAATIAAGMDAVIHLVHIRRMTPAAADETGMADDARAYIEAARDRLAATGARIATALIPAEPPELLRATPSPRAIAAHVLDYAADHSAALVAMTTHGRGGFSRLWFGSVADALLRTSTLPMLLVPTTAGRDAPVRIERVLLALAHDETADGIVRAARRITAALEPRIALLRIVPPGYAFVGDHIPGAVVIPGFDPDRERAAAERQLADHASALGADDAASVVRFDPAPARAILAFAEEFRADLIVIGTHGRRGLDRLLLGSVADKVVRGAECSVLVVPP